MCRLILLITLTLLISPVFAVGPFEIVYDPTVDADIIQTFSFFENEITDLETQIDDLDKALKLLAAGKYLWSDTSGLIDQLTSTLQQANGLSYAAKNEAAQFSALFPGYTTLAKFSEQYQQMTRTSLDTLNNILQNMQVSADNFIDENTRVRSLQGFVETVEGQTQALQTAAQLASEQVSQLQLLRQTIMAQANAQIVYYAQQIQKDASAVAELNSTIANGVTQTTGQLDTHPVEKPSFQ